jgi:hypothetical protein
MSEPLPVYQPFLNDLEAGIHTLDVPLLHDAIQLNNRDKADLTQPGRLLLAVEPPSITISRQDGAPLQVEMNYLHQGVPPEDIRKLVFAKPISNLALRFEWSSGAWIVETPTEIADQFGFEEFMTVVTSHAFQKQIKRNPLQQQGWLRILRDQ